MQALVCEVCRARTKFGIAIAANNPMMATTIIISTKVNAPTVRGLFVCMCVFILYGLLLGSGTR